MYQKSKYLLVLLCLMNFGYADAQPKLNSVSFEELEAFQSIEERPVFVYFTAEWCKYCKNVEQNSFRDSEIVNLLNNEFYLVIFDIETKETITFNGKEFRFKTTGLNTGVHELAEELGTIDGVLNTPTFVVMDDEFNSVYKYGGYLNANQLKKLLVAVDSFSSILPTASGL